MNKTELCPLILEPTIKNYIWGGRKFQHFLKPDQDPTLPIAEIWVIYEKNVVKNGPFTGRNLAEITTEFGNQFLGTNFQPTQNKFPLLIKLLESQQWLSIQVHPNDKQAMELEGPTFNGKTEGWFVLDAEPDAQLIAGLKPGIDDEQLFNAIQEGKVTSIVKYHNIEKDNFLYIPAGTIHALGPGATIYEIQQNSDVTYRVYDWDRPPSAGRPLHIEKSIAVTDKNIDVQLGTIRNGTLQQIFNGDYFTLDHFQTNGVETLTSDPEGKSFHAITVIEGKATLHSKFGDYHINQFESILVPANHPPYQLSGTFKLLRGSLNRK